MPDTTDKWHAADQAALRHDAETLAATLLRRAFNTSETSTALARALKQQPDARDSTFNGMVQDAADEVGDALARMAKKHEQRHGRRRR